MDEKTHDSPDDVARAVAYFGKGGKGHRTVLGREIDGYIAQIIYTLHPCGCGNPECDLFFDPALPYIDSFPFYSREDHDTLLARIPPDFTPSA